MSAAFAERIRAGRLRFHWSREHGAYVRVSRQGRNFLVELQPAGLILSPKRPTARGYVVWWETGPDGVSGADLLAMIVPLRGVKRVKRPFSFVVNNDGRLVS